MSQAARSRAIRNRLRSSTPATWSMPHRPGKSRYNGPSTRKRPGVARSGAQVGGSVEVEDGAAGPFGLVGGEVADRGGDLLGRRDPVERGLRAEFRSAAAISVPTYPRATMATEIPYGASARAMDCPNAFSPALLAP